MIIPLLIIFYAGELVWGERDARMGEISGAAPVPDWVFFVGKFLALAVVLVAWMLVLGLAGVIGQAVLGYPHFEIGVYAKVLLGLQLTDYLLFALLALTVHTVVNQKHLGTLAALVLYGVIAFAPLLGIEHKLLVFGASPDWSYSDIRGFGASLQPWLAFKAYWVAWALLLAVLARLAWVRGRESDVRARLKLARARLTRPTAITAALAGIAVLGLGAHVFYNTNVLNEYQSQAARLARPGRVRTPLRPLRRRAATARGRIEHARRNPSGTARRGVPRQLPAGESDRAGHRHRACRHGDRRRRRHAQPALRPTGHARAGRRRPRPSHLQARHAAAAGRVHAARLRGALRAARFRQSRRGRSHRRQWQLAQHARTSCPPSATSPCANCARPAIG